MRNRGWINTTVFFAVLAFAFATAAQVPQQPKFLVIKTIAENADYVEDSKTFDELLNQPGGIGHYDLQGMKANKDRAENALKSIKQLRDSGSPDTELIQLKSGSKTLAEVETMVLARHMDASKVTAMSELFQAGMGANAWVSDIAAGKKFDDGDISVMQFRGPALQKAVVEMYRLGFGEDFSTELNGQKLTLPQLREMADYVTEAGNALRKAWLAERAAKDAPYLKVLTGDRLRIFKQEFANLNGEWLCMGAGGVALTTPEQMKNAAAWYTYGNSRGLIDTYHVTGYKFSGDRLTGRTSRNGIGLKPSAAAYR
ncbi:MAG: hypothetical protein QM785_16000 [Pyrinomonadaceae bacterium]